MISTTADLTETGTIDTSFMVRSPAPIYAKTARASAPEELFAIGGDCKFFSAELTEFLFTSELDQYFQSSGTKQRLLRKGLAATISQAEDFDKCVQKVLQRVANSCSQDVVIASIDLLASLGAKIVPIAVSKSLGRDIENEDAAFVLSAAAARQGKLMAAILLKSKHRAIREGAVESLVKSAPLESKPLLSWIAQHDVSPALRARAQELIEG